MKIDAMNTILYCRHWDETVAFYRDTLGFATGMAAEWLVEFHVGPRAHLSIADEKRTKMRTAGGAGTTVTFKVADLRRVWRHLADKNVKVGSIRDSRLGGQAFFLRDPEGNRLEFWSDSSLGADKEAGSVEWSENERDGALLLELQRGLPLAPRPLARIGKRLGLTETDVLARIRGLFETGVARRFGAIFDARGLGYESTLCAADLPERDMETATARITPHPGITHCYQRDGQPNLWFTLTAPAENLGQELARVSEVLGPYEVLNLPALRKFKIEAVFGRRALGERPRDSAPVRKLASPPPGPVSPLSERERQVVRRLQGMVPVVEDPFAAIALELDYDPATFLDLLNRWKDMSILRRIGLIVRHQKLGFLANSMCVWVVPETRIETAGHTVARSPHVTHCYERSAFATFPFNLYAMIHAETREEAVRVFKQLGEDAALPPGRMLWSVREFKKSSPIFFL